ncbi:protease [Gossypium australe]|uniref:Protease n=1 Tax=Gossypium australe TaxID=47621 RepID=A0A5B6VLV8_9ROSI|nr:protease [Gossypium australe]
MRAKEDAYALDVITSNFTLFGIGIHIVIDPGSSHSYICTKFVEDKGFKISVLVTNSLGHITIVNGVIHDCLLEFGGITFSVDFFHEFDAILGLDWLARHDVGID